MSFTAQMKNAALPWPAQLRLDPELMIMTPFDRPRTPFQGVLVAPDIGLLK